MTVQRRVILLSGCDERPIGGGMTKATPNQVPGGQDGLAAACAETARRLVAAGDVAQATVYLERAGRLRCLAATGSGSIRDGLPADAGALGVAYANGRETCGQVAGPRGEAPATCLPIRAGGRVVGVLVVHAGLRVDDEALRRARGCADELGDRVAVLGGPPADADARRLLRDLGGLAALEPGSVGPAILDAALAAVPLPSALVAQRAPGHGLRPRWAAGPLAPALA